MKRLLIALSFILIAGNTFAQFADTSTLKAYLRDTIRDRRPEKVTAAQIQKALLGTINFLVPDAVKENTFSDSVKANIGIFSRHYNGGKRVDGIHIGFDKVKNENGKIWLKPWSVNTFGDTTWQDSYMHMGQDTPFSVLGTSLFNRSWMSSNPVTTMKRAGFELFGGSKLIRGHGSFQLMEGQGDYYRLIGGATDNLYLNHISDPENNVIHATYSGYTGKLNFPNQKGIRSTTRLATLSGNTVLSGINLNANGTVDITAPNGFTVNGESVGGEGGGSGGVGQFTKIWINPYGDFSDETYGDNLLINGMYGNNSIGATGPFIQVGDIAGNRKGYMRFPDPTQSFGSTVIGNYNGTQASTPFDNDITAHAKITLSDGTIDMEATKVSVNGNPVAILTPGNFYNLPGNADLFPGWSEPFPSGPAGGPGWYSVKFAGMLYVEDPGEVVIGMYADGTDPNLSGDANNLLGGKLYNTTQVGEFINVSTETVLYFPYNGEIDPNENLNALHIMIKTVNGGYVAAYVPGYGPGDPVKVKATTVTYRKLQGPE